jgi:hypothetical protein
VCQRIECLRVDCRKHTSVAEHRQVVDSTLRL